MHFQIETPDTALIFPESDMNQMWSAISVPQWIHFRAKCKMKMSGQLREFFKNETTEILNVGEQNMQ